MSNINPIEVPIFISFNFGEVNTILAGLGKLPYEQVEQLYSRIRSTAVQTLNEAELRALEQPVEALDADFENATSNLPPAAPLDQAGGVTAGEPA